MKKKEYVDELVTLVEHYANKLTVKQLRDIIKRHKGGTLNL